MRVARYGVHESQQGVASSESLPQSRAGCLRTKLSPDATLHSNCKDAYCIFLSSYSWCQNRVPFKSFYSKHPSPSPNFLPIWIPISSHLQHVFWRGIWSHVFISQLLTLLASYYWWAFLLHFHYSSWFQSFRKAWVI